MIYLLLSILSSTAIFVLFRSFKKYNINTLQAIVVNYFTACACGLIAYEAPIHISEIIKADWFMGAFLLGFLFIAIFNVMALTSQKNGLSVASVASKMSVIIPVIFGLYVYKESLGFQKIIGILLALIAVYLTSVNDRKDTVLTRSLYLPILLFLGSGVIDTSIKYIETTYVPKNGIPIFSATIFSFAALIGIVLVSYKHFKEKLFFKAKSIPFGLVLGIVNYSSIFFLLKALQMEGLESSALFTINNVAIVTITTLIGLAVFKEQISKLNWFGIGIAILSIVLVTLS